MILSNRLNWQRLALAFGLCATLAYSQTAPAPSLRILLPERTRLLQGQLVDLVVEVRNASAVSGLQVIAGDIDLTSRFTSPARVALDCDNSTDWVMRGDLLAFNNPGTVKLTVNATVDGRSISDTRNVDVRAFSVPQTKRNMILFIGDAMGTAYRDAARLVSKSIIDSQGKNSFREGFFDDLLAMDKMPVSGMVMTYGTDSIVPDSANTGTAWATGNKSFLNAVNVFADGTDCRWRFTGLANAANLPALLDNPRVENLWQYLKRRHGYRTGVVTTADVTDATPAVESAYSAFRQTKLEIARQYLENPMLAGRPAHDVVFGGGKDQFMPQTRSDGRDLIAEFSQKGYRTIGTATELNSLSGGAPVIGLFKGSARPALASDGIRAALDGDNNMEVAYDKLKFPRPASEPQPNFGAFTDQPMLDAMTRKAIEVLSNSQDNSPFILMVEAASIDKQSHPNHYTGTIWDTIEMDKSIGAARTWANARREKDTLIVVTADHDQSMHIIGVSNTPDTEYFNRGKKEEVTVRTPRGEQGFTVYGDSFTNARAGLPFINGSVGADNNRGPGGAPGSFAVTTVSANPAANTYSTYFGSPAYVLDSKTGYPLNSTTSGTIRRLAVGFRTGDHTGSSVPVTAEGPGAFLFTGYMDQTDIFFKVAAALTGDTAEGDRLLELLQQSGSRYPKTFGK